MNPKIITWNEECSEKIYTYYNAYNNILIYYYNIGPKKPVEQRKRKGCKEEQWMLLITVFRLA